MQDLLGGACFLFTIRLVLGTLSVLGYNYFCFRIFLLYQNLRKPWRKRSEKLSNSLEHDTAETDHCPPSPLPDAESEIRKLEAKLFELEARLPVPTTFPSIKFRTYKDQKRILVTGGAGFVGFHLVDTLMMDGHKVFVADNYFTGSRRNIEQLFCIII